MKIDSIFIGQLVVFAVANGFLGLASLFATYRLGEYQLSWSELVSGTLLLFVTLLVGCALLLGMLGQLSYQSLLIAVALAAVCLLILLRRSAPFRLPVCDPVHWFTTWRMRAGLFPLGLLCITGAALLAELYIGLTQPPLNGDDLGYHLPFAVTWLQTGDLFTTRAPFWFYPGTSELFVFWLLAPFRNDLFISLQNWLFLMLALASIYAISRRVGLSVAWGIYAALFFLGIRALHFQINTQNNDLVLAAFFLGGVSMLLAYARAQAVGSLVLVSLAMGLIIGVKYNGFYYAALLIVAYVLVAQRQRFGRTLRHLLFMSASASLLGGFWYVRNWRITGNPLAPLRVQFAGVTLFPGQELFMGNHIQDTMLLGRIRDLEALQLFWVALEKNGFLTSLGLLALALAGVVWVAKWLLPRWSEPRREVGLCVFLGLASVALLAATPLLVENVPHSLNQLRDAYSPIRYGFVTWALASVLLAWLLAYVDPRPGLLAMKTLIALIVLAPFVAALTRMIDVLQPFAALDAALSARFGLMLCLTLIAISAAEMRWHRGMSNPLRDAITITIPAAVPTGDSAKSMRLRNQVVWGGLAFLTLCAIIGVSLSVKDTRLVRRDRAYVGFFGPQYPAALQHIAEDNRRTLAVIDWQVPYFWYGPDFRNTVFLCSQNSSAALARCMAHNHVDMLVKVRNPFGDTPIPPDDPQLTGMQSWLNQVYSDPTISLYEVAGPIPALP